MLRNLDLVFFELTHSSIKGLSFLLRISFPEIHSLCSYNMLCLFYLTFIGYWSYLLIDLYPQLMIRKGKDHVSHIFFYLLSLLCEPETLPVTYQYSININWTKQHLNMISVKRSETVSNFISIFPLNGGFKIPILLVIIYLFF